MDIVSVTDMALQSAYATLKQLSDRTENITGKCASTLFSNLNAMDDLFKKDIQRFTENINALKEKLRYCIDENIAAIGERLSKIPEYENQTYRKLNII